MPLSEVINVARWRDPYWLALHRDLATYTAVDGHCFHTEEKPANELVRKGWEWTQCIFGLQRLGALRPNARALGVGAGREPVIFWLADRIAEVVATDLYGNETWSTVAGAEASAAVMLNPDQFCPRPFDPAKVRFEIADGTALPYSSSSFDIAWSLSSIEHFGGHAAAATAMREIARVLRPGGIACIATEFLLLDEYKHVEFFTRAEVQANLIEAAPDMFLVDGISWALPPMEFLIDAITIPQGVHRRRRHVVLNDGQVQWTSVILFLQKRSL